MPRRLVLATLVMMTASVPVMAQSVSAQSLAEQYLQEHPEAASAAVSAMQSQSSGGGTTPVPTGPTPSFSLAVPQNIQAPRPPAAPSASTAAAPPVPDASQTETSLGSVPVFGRSLFQGRFATESFKGFNPDYLISVGDQIDVKLWGVLDVQMTLEVDAQGNIFIPRVGPVRVVNVRNSELNSTVKTEVLSTYRENVGVYATLSAAVPVKVYISGFAHAPGLYSGYASDSLLAFIDRAGGIDPVAGSYVDIRLMRGGKVVATANLYDFLTKGVLPSLQFHDGDMIFVGPIGQTALVTGLVASPGQFEFRKGQSINELLSMAGINPKATNVSVSRSEGAKREVIYVPVGDPALDGPVVAGDQVTTMADRLLGQIAVTLEGEHEGAAQYVLPYNATMADLLAQVKMSAQSQPHGIQLYRLSVAERQKQVLDDMLRRLEQAVLSARSATDQEAELRTREAALVLQFVDRAKNIVPKGQVVLPRDYDASSIALENGDVVRIPRLSNLVEVHGEVFLPNAFVWRKGYYVEDYLKQAGGLIQSSAGDRVLLMRQSGEIASENGGGFIFSSRVEPGDEIMVLPAVDTKHFQFGKDVVQIIYQIAVAAGVVARL